MNKYEFYSKLLQEDFPVKYRQDFAEHDSEQCKKIANLKSQLVEAVNLLRKKQEYLEAPYPYGAYSYGLHGTAKAALIEVQDFLARHVQAEQQE